MPGSRLVLVLVISRLGFETTIVGGGPIRKPRPTIGGVLTVAYLLQARLGLRFQECALLGLLLGSSLTQVLDSFCAAPD